MIKARYIITGSEKVKSALNKVEKKVVEGEKKAILTAAILVERDAKKYVPVETGRLRSSITHKPTEFKGAVDAIVGTNVEYAPYVERGYLFGKVPRKAGKRMPWLYPALAENSKYISDLLAQTIKVEVKFAL